jgi:DSF synthase
MSPPLEVTVEPEGVLWASFNRGSFTPDLLAGIRDLLAEPAVSTIVWASSGPVWNRGGDLALFARLIRAGDAAGLRDYAHACVDVIAGNLNAAPLTVALVEGDALGGGFEAVLTNDLIVAAKGVKFGLPEILFHMFPGMGAYSLLCRYLDGARARQLILNRRLYSAEELADMGLVDLVLEPGAGRAVVLDWLAREQRRHRIVRTLREVRHRCQPLAYDELIEVVELWVETALGLGEADLRRMDRLAAAQRRSASPA